MHDRNAQLDYRLLVFTVLLRLPQSSITMMTYIASLALLLLSLDSAAAGKRGLPSASGHADSSTSLQEAPASDLIVEDPPDEMELEIDVYDPVTAGFSHSKFAAVPIAAPAAGPIEAPVDPRMYDFAAALQASLAQNKKHEKDILYYLICIKHRKEAGGSQHPDNCHVP